MTGYFCQSLRLDGYFEFDGQIIPSKFPFLNGNSVPWQVLPFGIASIFLRNL
jgi:hypothetical protein